MNTRIRYKNKFCIRVESESFLDKSLPEVDDPEPEPDLPLLPTVEEMSAQKEDSVETSPPKGAGGKLNQYITQVEEPTEGIDLLSDLHKIHMVQTL